MCPLKQACYLLHPSSNLLTTALRSSTVVNPFCTRIQCSQLVGVNSYQHENIGNLKRKNWTTICSPTFLLFKYQFKRRIWSASGTTSRCAFQYERLKHHLVPRIRIAVLFKQISPVKHENSHTKYI